MSFHGSDSALGSSSLYLDGIPFKIGEKFKRPAKVTLPNLVSQTDVTGALTEEYSFSTEEAVLAWISDVRHAEDVKRQEELERVERESEIALEQDKSANEDESEETEVKEINWDKPAVTETNTCWSNPVLANFSSDLLKPLIASNSASSVPHVPASRGSDFDLRSFDKVDDPFDNLELQVIDDLEMLKSVLQGSHSAVNNGNQEKPDNEPDRQTDSNHNANSCDATKVNLRKNAVKLKRGKIGSSVTSSVCSSDSTEVVHSNPQYVNFQPFMDNSKTKTDGAIPTQLPPIKDALLSSQRQSVALPPLRGQGSAGNPSNSSSDQRVRPSSNPELELLGNGQALFKNHSESDYENVVSDYDNMVIDGDQSPSHGRHSISADYENVPPLVDRSSKVHAGIERHVLNKNNLRNARSTPSLLHGEAQSSLSHSPPARPSSGQPSAPIAPVDKVDPPKPAPRMVRVLPQTPDQQIAAPAKTSVNVMKSIEEAPKQQCCAPQSVTPSNIENKPKENGVQVEGRRTWNKYTPLPPPRGQNGTKPPMLPPKPINNRSPEPVIANNPNSKGPSESLSSDNEDPYRSLSIEAQAFVNSLTNMGFPRPRAARAVLKLGQDHKLVVEHLCLINSLIEKGYSAPLSEMALHLFTNDFNKAVKYLDLYIQFQELGFQKEKIREALVRNDIDRDKALDFLTA